MIPKQKNAGFLLIQLVIVLVVITIISSIVVLNLSNFSEAQQLNNNVDEVTALVNEARSRTLLGEATNYYGVHLEDTKAVLFPGPSYSDGAVGNKKIVLNTAIEIESISLAGGGSDIIFTQLTGDTSQYGTFIMKRVSTTAGQKTLSVSKSGIVSSD